MTGTEGLNRESIIYDLLEAPQKIEVREKILHDAKLDVAGAKDDYEEAESRLLLATREDGTPEIDGKNEAIRKAQIAQRLAGYQTVIRDREANAMDAERRFNRAANDFRALRAVAAIIAAGGEK